MEDKELLAISIAFSFLGLIMLFYLAGTNYQIKNSKNENKIVDFESFSEINENFLEKTIKVSGKIAEVKETEKGNFYGYIEDSRGEKLRFFVLASGNRRNRECFKKGMLIEIYGRLTTFENELEIFSDLSKVDCMNLEF